MEWDDRKAAANLRKHGVSFALAPFFPLRPPLKPLILKVMNMAKTVSSHSAKSTARSTRSSMRGARAKSASSASAKRAHEKGAATKRGSDEVNLRPDMKLRPVAEETLAIVRKGRGRPPSELPKAQVTLRVDREVLEHFKTEGRGWQTRINAALRKAIARKT